MGGVLIDDTERTDVFVASATSTGEGSITIEGKHIEGFRRWYQQLQAQYDLPVKIKPRSKRGQRNRTWKGGR